jgi:chromosomal replication initiator protein
MELTGAPVAAPLEAAWDSIRTGLRRDLGARTFDGWLKPAELGAFDPDAGALDIVMPSQFMADWVRSHFSERLTLAWKTVLPVVREVRVMAAVDAPRPTPLLILEEAPPPAERDPDAPNFDPRYRFETFIVGKANEVAATAARTVAVGGMETGSFNPLFIHGGTGRGKTHLLHAIGHAFVAKNPGKRVVSMSAEKFMVEFIRALKENDTISFKQRLRTADLLLIDDVQFIAKGDSTQEEFFHTMNEIIGAGRKLVITSDRAPQDLDGIAPRILSRLSWGLVADINPADYELRFNIIVAKLEALPAVQMPRNVIDFLARRVTSSIRELEGALNRIIAFSMLNHKPLNATVAAEALSDLAANNRRKQITPARVVETVASFYSMDTDELKTKSRSREVVVPRQIAMYIIREETDTSLTDIGAAFGNRDHTTVMHACEKIEKAKETDNQIRQAVLAIRQMLYGDSLH